MSVLQKMIWQCEAHINSCHLIERSLWMKLSKLWCNILKTDALLNLLEKLNFELSAGEKQNRNLNR